MDVFLQNVVTLIRSMGFKNASLAYPGSDKIRIGELTFYCEAVRNRRNRITGITVALEDSTFCPTPQDAAIAIVGGVPYMIERKRKSDLWSKMYGECIEVNKRLRGTNCETGVSGEEYKLTVTSKDLDTIKGMIVYIQDTFLNEMQGPKMQDNDFMMKQIRFLLKGCDREQLTEIKNHCLQEIEYKLEAENEARYESEVVHDEGDK